MDYCVKVQSPSGNVLHSKLLPQTTLQIFCLL